MKMKLISALIALISTSAAYAGFAVKAESKTPEDLAPIFLGSTKVFAKYTLSSDRLPIITPTVLNIPENISLVENTCTKPTLNCSMSFSYTATNDSVPSNFKPSFKIANVTLSGDSVTVPGIDDKANLKGVTLPAGIDFIAPNAVTFHFVNTESRLRSMNIDMNLPMGITLFNTCRNVTHMGACDIFVTGLPINHIPVESKYITINGTTFDSTNYTYQTTTSVDWFNIQQSVQNTTSNGIVVISPETDSKGGIKQLIASLNDGQTWTNLIGDINALGFVSPKNFVLSNSNILYFIVPDQLSPHGSLIIGMDLKKDTTKKYNVPDTIYSLAVYTDANNKEYLFAAAGNVLYSKNITDDEEWKDIYRYPAHKTGAPFPGIFLSGQVAISPTNNKLYYFVTSTSSVYHLAGFEFDLSNGVVKFPANTPYFLFIDYGNEGKPFFIVQGTNVFVKTNNGRLLKKVNGGNVEVAPPTGSGSLTYIAGNNYALFAATKDAASPLLQTKDGGATWAHIPVPQTAVAPFKEVQVLPGNYLKVTDSNNQTFIVAAQ